MDEPLPAVHAEGRVWLYSSDEMVAWDHGDDPDEIQEGSP